MYEIRFIKSAVKDVEKLKAAGLGNKAKALLEILRENPYQNPPPYEKLKGQMSGYYSRRINIQHRLVYSVDDEKRMIVVVALWSHYETV